VGRRWVVAPPPLALDVRRQLGIRRLSDLAGDVTGLATALLAFERDLTIGRLACRPTNPAFWGSFKLDPTTGRANHRFPVPIGQDDLQRLGGAIFLHSTSSHWETPFEERWRYGEGAIYPHPGHPAKVCPNGVSP